MVRRQIPLVLWSQEGDCSDGDITMSTVVRYSWSRQVDLVKLELSLWMLKKILVLGAVGVRTNARRCGDRPAPDVLGFEPGRVLGSGL